MSAILVVDNTILSAVARSTTLAAVRYILGFKAAEDEKSRRLRMGGAGHAALAYWLLGGSVESAKRLFAEQYEQWSREHVVDDTDPWGWANSSRVLEAWFLRHPYLSTLPVTIDPKWVESSHPPTAPLGEVKTALGTTYEIVFQARLDAFGVDKFENEWVVDHKFTGRLDEWRKKNWTVSSQFSGYSWIGQLKRNRSKAISGTLVNAICVERLPSDEGRKCLKHGTKFAECGLLHLRSEWIPTYRNERQIEEWKRTALVLATRYATLVEAFGGVARSPDEAWSKVPLISALTRLEGQFLYDACPGCEFYEWCLTGRPLEAIERMVWEPWIVGEEEA